METLPVPNDARVQLTPPLAKRFVVIRFSGLASDTLTRAKTDKLSEYALEHKLNTVGEPVFAFYNPPWTLPLFRRNEIMLELTES